MTDNSIADATPIRTEAAQRILTAARHLFTEHGVDGVSIRDIAARADVSKANVFHHFGNKARLYDAVLEDSRLTFDALLVNLADSSRPLDERLERFTLDHLHTMLRDPSSVNLFLRQMLNPRGNPQRQRAEETIGDGLTELIETLEGALPEAGQDNRDTALVLALTLLGGAFMHFQLRDVLPRLDANGTGCDPQRYCAHLVDLLRSGLTGRNT
ncbi:TetR/AcrR family transcriptional regulator [Aquisalimonas sp.]|uniref:TetR/AcrR family transcriptional regulator n=1 Tax=Aquisalimonas sp. TaxID=1872621 RepID=UPI0025C3275B|nr:TetR/AcrR family transcriptional regulator [Aquisalimonas sp.]